jgi:hypothetical protein
MENVLGHLPGEIQWNIIKYMRHPVADVFLRVSNNYDWDETKGETFSSSWFQRKRFVSHLISVESVARFLQQCKITNTSRGISDVKLE